MEKTNVEEFEKKLRSQAKLGLVGIVASALLGATLTYSILTKRHEREMNELIYHAVSERVGLYLDEWADRASRNEQVDHRQLANQYGIPLTTRGAIDSQALKNTMFHLKEQD